LASASSLRPIIELLLQGAAIHEELRLFAAGVVDVKFNFGTSIGNIEFAHSARYARGDTHNPNRRI